MKDEGPQDEGTGEYWGFPFLRKEAYSRLGANLLDKTIYLTI